MRYSHASRRNHGHRCPYSGYRCEKTRSSLIQSQLTDLSVVPFDPELSIGAANAVNACLRIQPHERVTIITDLASREIAASIVDQLKKTNAPFRSFVLEEIA